MNREEAAKILVRGGIAVMPTDTLLGIVGSALRPKTVERIYRVRCRDQRKPLIVLIASQRELKRFGIVMTPRLAAFLRNVWLVRQVHGRPVPVSVVLPCPHSRFRYLHRGTETIAFRVPASAPLRSLLRATGPLVAPSANRAGEPSCRTIAEARRAFGDAVDAYLPGRSGSATPSLVIKVLRH